MTAGDDRDGNDTYCRRHEGSTETTNASPSRRQFRVETAMRTRVVIEFESGNHRAATKGWDGYPGKQHRRRAKSFTSHYL